jgi:predicted P-loop ATPase
MTVFISERQGTSKSTLAKVLALNSDWFAEDVSLGEASKELVLLLAGKAVAEISEMKTRGQVEDLKRMLSRTHDEARTAYSRKPTKRARRNIFIGSTNDPEFLEDVTGGRRFLPITVRGEIDLDFVRSNLAQLVGEAATQQAQGVDINLPRDVWEIAGQHQEAARITTGTEELLRDWYETPETDVFVRSAEIVKRLADERQIGTNMKAIAPIMRRIGYERDRTNAERLWVKSATGKYHAGCRHVGRVPQIMGPPPAVPAPRQPSQPIEHVTQPPKAIPAPPF